MALEVAGQPVAFEIDVGDDPIVSVEKYGELCLQCLGAEFPPGPLDDNLVEDGVVQPDGA